MTRKHGISWLNMPGYKGETWNPVVGCDIVSPGCTNCYAMKMAHRICAMQPDSHYQGTVKTVNGKPVWTGKIAAAPEKTLNAPLRWKTPRMVFVNSMGDLFHEGVTDEVMDLVFSIMALSPQHIFVILTKRPARMRYYINTPERSVQVWHDAIKTAAETKLPIGRINHLSTGLEGIRWPLPNVWLGVSAENQEQAAARIPYLMYTPAAKRIVSVEPMLGAVDLRPWLFNITHEDEIKIASGAALCTPLPFHENPPPEEISQPRLDWVICGGESGAGRRFMATKWARDLRDQCADAKVPFFFKQHIGRGLDDDLLDGERHHNWPTVAS